MIKLFNCCDWNCTTTYRGFSDSSLPIAGFIHHSGVPTCIGATIKERLADVQPDVEAIEGMLARASAESTVIDIIAAVELLVDDAVLEYRDTTDERRAEVTLDATAFSDGEAHALRSYIGAVDGWHLDDRPRKDDTWYIRSH